MKRIPLTNSREFAIIDNIDFDSVSQYSWGIQDNGYVRTFIEGKMVYLHRFIMGALKGERVDHKFGNKLDNRRLKLRKCTQSQNRANSVKRKNSFCEFKGVTWDKKREKFLARIGINGIGKNLGRFDLAVDAAKAYNSAAKKHYGEFAKLNIIPRESI